MILLCRLRLPILTIRSDRISIGTIAKVIILEPDNESLPSPPGIYAKTMFIALASTPCSPSYTYLPLTSPTPIDAVSVYGSFEIEGVIIYGVLTLKTLLKLFVLYGAN